MKALKPAILKLASLFAKYLYQNKTLNLPGIGVFSIDPTLPVPDLNDKAFPDFVRQINFTQKNIQRADEEFINFIRTETGKIKPLAESDLDSFLTDGKILLNIGKPFLIDGIGSISKAKSGDYEFTPGDAALQRLEPLPHEVADHHTKRPSLYTDQAAQPDARKYLLAGAVVIGIALVIWGGFTLYNRNTTAMSPAAISAMNDTIAIAPSDTSRANVILDSVQNIIDSAKQSLVDSASRKEFKFVIEKTNNQARARRRFKQLREIPTDIRMESEDSLSYTLYFMLPAVAADTARIKDSLKTWYARKYVYIER